MPLAHGFLELITRHRELPAEGCVWWVAPGRAAAATVVPGLSSDLSRRSSRAGRLHHQAGDFGLGFLTRDFFSFPEAKPDPSSFPGTFH